MPEKVVQINEEVSKRQIKKLIRGSAEDPPQTVRKLDF